MFVLGLDVAEVSNSTQQLQLQSQLVVEEDALVSWDSLNQVNLSFSFRNPLICKTNSLSSQLQIHCDEWKCPILKYTEN